MREKGSSVVDKIQAVATSADDGLLFPPERYPELTNQARQVGSSYGKGNRGAKFHPFLKMFRSELILHRCAMCKICFSSQDCLII